MPLPSYATTTDLERLGVLPAALAGIATATKEAHLSAASRRADSYLAAQFELPLVAWEEDLTDAVCALCAWTLLVTRGFNPDAPGDQAVRIRYEDAIRWLEKVAAEQVTPLVTDSSQGSSAGVSATPLIESATQRGWSSRGSADVIEGGFEGD